ncbi:MAG TPA: nucleoside triphosphate pyrophosphohydrolase [Longimicrobiales bacterium]|nr:nucleoside triphosphate pyrophosphohydrolase [Longimicrobiales bacterium]
MSTPQADPTLDRAVQLVRFLRQNCPWDAAQTPTSLLPYLLEEAHETAEAVSAGDEAELRAELGDLLLNVAFQIVLAEERRAFDAEAVVTTLEEKMRRRHPHLYGEGPAVPWEELKAREKAREQAARGEAPTSILASVPRGLDPLSRAHRIQEKVSGVGFDWNDARGAFEKVAEELEEVREALEAEPSPALEEELGDLLFAVVNLTRLAGTHAMGALQRANAKFMRRFESVERLARERGLEMGKASLEELDGIWNEVKAEERGE